MDEKTQTLKIVAASPLNARSLRLEFNNGEVRLFDSHRLRGGIYIPLMNEKYFTRPIVKDGDLGWEGLDITCRAQYIYERSVPYDGEDHVAEYVPTKKDILHERIAMVVFPLMALAGIIGIVAWYMSL